MTWELTFARYILDGADHARRIDAYALHMRIAAVSCAAVPRRPRQIRRHIDNHGCTHDK